jgi:hypothetical protein
MPQAKIASKSVVRFKKKRNTVPLQLTEKQEKETTVIHRQEIKPNR